MNQWRMAAIILAVLWILPGRHGEQVLEPADDVWPEVQKIITEHKGPPMLTLSHMYVRGGGFVTWQKEGGPTSCDPEPPNRYFFHDTIAWHWPWWNFPRNGGAYEWAKGHPNSIVWYTNHITLDEVKAHRHLYWGEDK